MYINVSYSSLSSLTKSWSRFFSLYYVPPSMLCSRASSSSRIFFSRMSFFAPLPTFSHFLTFHIHVFLPPPYSYLLMPPPFCSLSPSLSTGREKWWGKGVNVSSFCRSAERTPCNLEKRNKNQKKIIWFFMTSLQWGKAYRLTPGSASEGIRKNVLERCACFIEVFDCLASTCAQPARVCKPFTANLPVF